MNPFWRTAAPARARAFLFASLLGLRNRQGRRIFRKSEVIELVRDVLGLPPDASLRERLGVEDCRRAVVRLIGRGIL